MIATRDGRGRIVRSMAILRDGGSRFWLVSAAWAAGFALAVGIPTLLIPNQLFRRMTPVRWWDFAYWAVAAPLAGLLLASRRLPATTSCNVEGRALAGSGLTYLAVACPICNKLVVAILGVSGALNVFAPIQPVLGALGVGILAAALLRRLSLASSAGALSASDAWTERHPNAGGFSYVE